MATHLLVIGIRVIWSRQATPTFGSHLHPSLAAPYRGTQSPHGGQKILSTPSRSSSAVGPLRWDLLTHSATNAKYSFWFVGMRRLHDTQALVTRLANRSFVKLMHEVKEAYHLWSIENYVSGSHLLSSFVTMVTLWGLVCYSSF